MLLPTFAGRILPVDHSIARLAGRLEWPSPTDLRNALIASTAIINGATVVTRNVRHFKDAGIDMADPWEFSPREN